MVGVGGSDPMDFHALEAMQCMIERRRGGETGVRSVQMIEGDAVWKAGDQKRWSWSLLESALSRSDSLKGLTAQDGRTQNLTQGGAIQRIVPSPAAYFIDYADGTQATLLMLNGALGDYNFAARVRGRARPDLLPVPASSQPQRRLLGLPDAARRIHDRNRPCFVPRRAHAPCQRHARELPRFQDTRPRQPRDASPGRSLPTAREGGVLRCLRCQGRVSREL